MVEGQCGGAPVTARSARSSTGQTLIRLGTVLAALLLFAPRAARASTERTLGLTERVELALALERALERHRSHRGWPVRSLA